MQCPYCNSFFTPTTNDLDTAYLTFSTTDNLFYEKIMEVSHTVCPNKACRNFIVNIRIIGKRMTNATSVEKRTIFDKNIIPAGIIKRYPDYIPQQIREDYQEACEIVELSPKASATLARRCLQGIIRDFHNTKSDQLKKAIDELKDVIEPALWEAIDSVRQIGNIGAHMEKNINTIIEIDPGEAKKLIGLIELLFEEWYIRRHERQQKLNAITGIAEEKKAQKVNKPSSPTDDGTSLLTP
jgi:hypothetical protein